MTEITISPRSKIKLSTQALRILEALFQNSLLMVTVIVIIVYTIIARDRNFFTFDNLVNMLVAATVTGFLTWGLAVTMLAGNIDFSTLGISAIATILVGVMYTQAGWGAIPTMLFVMAGTAMVSLITSVLILEFKIPGLVATFAVNGSYTAAAMYLCKNLQINIRKPELSNILLGSPILGIPLTVWVMLLFFVFAWVVLNHTKLGAHIYATGANPVAARLNGVSVKLVTRITLMWCAVCVAMAAIVQTTRAGVTLLYGSSGGLQPNLTAVVLGGISIFGGAGRLQDMFLAIMFMTVVANGLYLMGASAGTIQMVNGVVFLIAILMGAARGWFAKKRV